MIKMRSQGQLSVADLYESIYLRLHAVHRGEFCLTLLEKLFLLLEEFSLFLI